MKHKTTTDLIASGELTIQKLLQSYWAHECDEKELARAAFIAGYELATNRASTRIQEQIDKLKADLGDLDP